MTERESPDSPDDLAERLRRARDERDAAAGGKTEADARRNGVGFAMRLGVEIVAALIVGVGIGLILDSWLGTKPWLMIVFFVLGAAAGMFNVFRVVRNQGGAVGYHPAERTHRRREEADRNGE